LITKKKKTAKKSPNINWVWWYMPVIPANQEAKAGESQVQGHLRQK
jgi:hypothetical protein